MKRKFIFTLVISIIANLLLLYASGYLYLRFYTYKLKTNYSQNISKDRKIAMIGNSITENWNSLHQSFFETNGIANIGIGGNTSEDILLRFRHDVINQSYETVILNIGINDICQENYSSNITVDNILNIVELCKLHNIELILTSVLPATDKFKVSFVTTFSISPQRIEELNRSIEQIAMQNNLKYIDYTQEINRGEFIKKYTYDGIHPNYEGYLLLEKILQPTIDSIQQEY